MAVKLKVRKGDKVVVTSGKDKDFSMSNYGSPF